MCTYMCVLVRAIYEDPRPSNALAFGQTAMCYVKNKANTYMFICIYERSHHPQQASHCHTMQRQLWSEIRTTSWLCCGVITITQIYKSHFFYHILLLAAVIVGVVVRMAAVAGTIKWASRCEHFNTHSPFCCLNIYCVCFLLFLRPNLLNVW